MAITNIILSQVFATTSLSTRTIEQTEGNLILWRNRVRFIEKPRKMKICQFRPKQIRF